MSMAINNHKSVTIENNGAYKTIMDIQVAQLYCFKVHGAVARNCRKLKVPGSGLEQDYVRLVEDSLELRVRELSQVHAKYFLGD